MRIPDNTVLGQDTFQPGAVILQKLLNDLKSKLPLKKKAKDEDEELQENAEETNPSHQSDETDANNISDIEADEELDQDSSLIHRLKSKIQKMNAKGSKNADAKTDDEDDEDSLAAAKKKRNSTIIRVVIGLGLVTFLAEDYIFPPEEVAPPAVVLKSRKRPVAKPAETAVVPPVETTPAEVPSDTTVETSSETTPETPVGTPPESPVDVTSTEVTPSETSTTETPIEEPSPEPSETTTIGDTPSQDTVDGEATTSSDENLTDKILQDLENQAKTKEVKEQKKEYVSPPEYEYRGKGLVYNCAGKHWACIDGPSYKACEDNASSTEYLKRPIECHPFNVYETVKGCESMQNRMVSASAKTNFCGNN